MLTRNQYILFCFFFSCVVNIGLAQDYIINDYHIDVVLTKDGKAEITENINLEFFKRRRGIIRTIHTTRDVGNMLQYTPIDNISIKDKEFKLSKSKAKSEIRIGDPSKYITGNQSYELTYVVENVITPYDEHDEYLWDLVGLEWDAEIDKTSFRIHMPEEITLDANDIAVFTGSRSSLNQHANLSISKKVIEGQALDPLGNGAGLTAAIKFPKYYFSALDYNSILSEKPKNSTYRATPKKEYPRDLAFPIPLLLIAAISFLFKSRGRNTHKTIIEKRYYPPEGMSPPEIGAYHDFTVNSSDLISLIPYWGANKNLNITAIKNDGEVDMRFEKLEDLPASASPYEHEFFNAIFKDGDTAYLHNMENTMYEMFGSLKGKLKREILSKKLYDQKAKQFFHSGKFLLLGIISILIGITSIAALQAIASGILFIILGIVCFIIHASKPKKNERGLILHDQLQSLKTTLTNPDPNDLNKVISDDPLYLNKIFPYVVAFGLDKTWDDKVGAMFTSPPDWYYSEYDSHPSFDTFRHNFSVNKITKTMTSAPVADDSSSAFGGRGGGGFSGGVGSGGGGGGGSSW